MKLSIVATLYHSAPYLTEFHARVSTVAQQLADEDYEIILVNDGSPDASLELAIQLTEDDPHVLVVDLSRNFGHHKAMMTGLSQARGSLIFLLDSDLEEEPEWLPIFAQQMQQGACDVVFGVQRQRKGGWFERWSGLLFYRIFNLMTNLAIPENPVTARLMSRRYVNALLRHQEREIPFIGLCHMTGFVQRPCQVDKHHTSQTTYTFAKKLSNSINAITSFSNLPLNAIFYLGVAILIADFFYLSYLVLRLLFLNNPISGWTSIMVSIWFLGGVIISFIGIIGIYLSKIFIEVKQRPYTIIRQLYGQRKNDID